MSSPHRGRAREAAGKPPAPSGFEELIRSGEKALEAKRFEKPRQTSRRQPAFGPTHGLASSFSRPTRHG